MTGSRLRVEEVEEVDGMSMVALVAGTLPRGTSDFANGEFCRFKVNYAKDPRSGHNKITRIEVQMATRWEEVFPVPRSMGRHLTTADRSPILCAINNHQRDLGFSPQQRFLVLT